MAGVTVFVLGMHRSGTSVLTRVINLLGVSLSVPSDWAASGPDNVTGYWESRQLTELNDRILARFGGDSLRPPPLPAGWHNDSRLADLRGQASATLASVYRTPQWVWKDPRTCLTFPFWRGLTGHIALAALTYRNPLEVAASLEARNGVSREHALAVWERYVRQSLLHLRGLPVFVLSYSDLLAEPVALASHIRQFLAAQGVQLSERLPEEEILGFVHEGLRHAKYPSDLRFEPDVSESQAALFDLLKASDGPHSSLCLPPLPDESPTTETLLARERALLFARQQAWNHHLTQANNWLEHQRGAWEQAATEQARLVSDQKAFIGELTHAHAWLEQQRDAWEQAAADQVGIVQEQQAQIHALVESNAWLEQQRDAWEQATAEQASIVRAQQAQIRSLSKAHT